jgi:hypothetical protein
MRLVRNLAISFVAMLFCYAVDGMEILKVKEGRVLIRLDGRTVSVGEQLDVLEAGKKNGVVRVTSFNDTKALAKIETGLPNAGMQVAKRTVTVAVPAKNSAQSKRDFNYDFRVNPVGLISGGIDANLDFKLTENLTVGPQGIYLHAQLSPSGIYTSNYDITAYGFGARANWFFDGAFKDGWYFGPSFEYLKVTLKTTDAVGPATGSASGMLASGIIGYGWFWDNFNLMLGGGYASVLGASSITIKDSAGNQTVITANLSGLTYELSIGWAF